MKSKKYLYVVTILYLLYSFAFFQKVYSQSNCNKHGFRPLNLPYQPSSFPEAWYFISPDTVVLFDANRVLLYQGIKSEKPKYFISSLTTNEESDTTTAEIEKWTCTSVSFVNSQLGYASAIQYTTDLHTLPNTNRGGIFKTTNGGIKWIKIKGDSNLLTKGIHSFEIRKKSWYAFSGGNFIKSTDEGLTWTIIGIPHTRFENPYALTFNFIDDSTIVAGGRNVIWKSIDGGRTWKSTLILECNVNSIIFFKRNKGLAVGSNRTTCTYQTEDGGETWQKVNFGLPIGQTSNLSYLYKVNDSTAFGTGENMRLTCNYWEKDRINKNFGFLTKTIDAGKTWEFFYGCPVPYWDNTPGLIPYAPMFVWASDQSDSSVFIYGRNELFYSGHGGKYTSIDENLKENLTTKFFTYPNPSVNHFTIESSEGIKTVSMYDLLGKRVLYKQSSLERTMKLDVQDFPQGIYLLQVETDAGSATQKVVVE